MKTSKLEKLICSVLIIVLWMVGNASLMAQRGNKNPRPKPTPTRPPSITPTEIPTNRDMWVQFAGASIFGVHRDERDAEIIYATTPIGLFRTTDRGFHWDLFFSPPFPEPDKLLNDRVNYYPPAESMHFAQSKSCLPSQSTESVLAVDDATDTIYFGGHGGYRTFSASRLSWQWFRVDDESAKITNLFKAPDGTVFLTAVGADGTGSVYLIKRTANGTQSIIENSRGYRSPSAIGLSVANPEIMYAGDQISEDGGFSWRKVGITNVNSIAVSPLSGKTVYVYGGTIVFVTTNGGESWTRTNPGISVTILYPDQQDAGTVYASDGNSIIRSRNNGASWEALTQGTPFGKISDFAISPNSPNTIYQATDRGIWMSTNSGKTWQAYSKGLNGDNIFRVIASTKMVVAKGRYGIYRLSDDKIGWAAKLWQEYEKSPATTR